MFSIEKSTVKMQSYVLFPLYNRNGSVIAESVVEVPKRVDQAVAVFLQQSEQDLGDAGVNIKYSDLGDCLRCKQSYSDIYSYNYQHNSKATY